MPQNIGNVENGYQQHTVDCTQFLVNGQNCAKPFVVSFQCGCSTIRLLTQILICAMLGDPFSIELSRASQPRSGATLSEHHWGSSFRSHISCNTCQ